MTGSIDEAGGGYGRPRYSDDVLMRERDIAIRDCAAWVKRAEKAEAEVERLQQANAGMAKDAARWQWAVGYGEAGDSALDDRAWDVLTGPYVKEYIDAEVDAAIAAAAEGSHGQ